MAFSLAAPIPVSSVAFDTLFASYVGPLPKILGDVILIFFFVC